MSEIRTEHDMLGAVSVPAAALYGAQTARGAANFGTTSARLADRPELLRALAQVKAAAAEANRELGVLDPAIADAIVRAPGELAGLGDVIEALERLAKKAGDDVRLGRTCLQDAVPLPIAAYHGAQVTAVRRAAAELRRSVEALLEVPLGATAVGTGIGAPAGYRALAVDLLAQRSGFPL